MAEPVPTNNAPVGAPTNTFRIDPGTTSLMQSPNPGPKGLFEDPWPNINLRAHGATIGAAVNRFVLEFRKEILGVSPQMLARYEQQLTGSKGAKFKKRVVDAASKTGVNAGLLAAVCLFEQAKASFWTRTTGEGSTYRAGSDHFYTRRHSIRRAAPEASSIRILRTEGGTNEQRNAVTIAYVPASQLVLVTACYLKERIAVMRRIYNSEGGQFDMLPNYMQFFLSRLIFNPGKVSLRRRSRQILDGENLLVTQGARRSDRPRRGATICAALAMQLNLKYFNQ